MAGIESNYAYGVKTGVSLARYRAVARTLRTAARSDATRAVALSLWLRFVWVSRRPADSFDTNLELRFSLRFEARVEISDLTMRSLDEVHLSFQNTLSDAYPCRDTGAIQNVRKSRTCRARGRWDSAQSKRCLLDFALALNEHVPVLSVEFAHAAHDAALAEVR